MIEIKRYDEFINEFALKVSWFDNNIEHEIAKIPKNITTKEDIKNITIEDETLFYNGGEIIEYTLQKNGFIEIVIIKPMGISLLSLCIIKIIQHLKEDRLIFTFSYTMYDYSSLRFKLVDKLIEYGYTNIASFTRKEDDGIVYYKDKKTFRRSFESLIRKHASSITIEDVTTDKKSSLDGSYNVSIVKLNNILTSYIKRYEPKDKERIEDFVSGNYKFLIDDDGELNVEHIPDILKGTGIGYLIYKKVIQEYGFAKTGETSKLALQVWRKLLQDDDFYHVIIDDNNVAVLSKDKDESTLIWAMSRILLGLEDPIDKDNIDFELLNKYPNILDYVEEINKDFDSEWI